MEKNALQQNKDNTLPLVQISSDLDIFRAKPIILQRKQNGDEPVLVQIRLSVERCAMGLGIKLSEDQIYILCTDIMEVYSHDSIEDIQQCLKKARQGKYGFAFKREGITVIHKRDCLTMGLIKDWMIEHLTEKSITRERLIQKRKEKESESHPVSDKASEYIAKIKENISKGNKEEKVKPFDNSEKGWQEAIENDPIIRAFFESKLK